MAFFSKHRWYAIVSVAFALTSGVLLGRLPLRSTPNAGENHLPAEQTENAAVPHTQPTRQPSDMAPATSLGWPNLFGPFRTSHSPENNVLTTWPASGPPEKWRRRIGTGYSAPVVDGDRLIVFHREENQEIVDCLDAETGEPRWRFAWPTAYECRYNYSSGPYSTPTIDQSQVYALGAEGRLYCLAMEDGRKLWERSLAKQYHVEPGMFAVAVSPLVENDRLILNIGGVKTGAGIVAIDKNTGQTLWTATNHGASYASACAATIHGQRYVFVFTRDGLVALDPASGHVWWCIPFSARNPQKENATSPVVSQDMVLVSAFCAGSLCVQVKEPGDYDVLWQNPTSLDSQYNNLVCADGYLYGFASDNSFRCVEIRTGRLCWKWRSRLGAGASLAVDNRFLLWGEKGHLASLDINPTKPLLASITAKPLMAAPCFTAPALHRGLLYLRNEETLLCLDLRGTPPPKTKNESQSP